MEDLLRGSAPQVLAVVARRYGDLADAPMVTLNRAVAAAAPSSARRRR